jgi:hypothetical protein
MGVTYMEQNFKEKYGIDASAAGWQVLRHEKNFIDYENKTMYCNNVRHLDYYIDLNSWGNVSVNTFFVISKDKIILKPIMKELFELMYCGWSYLIDEDTLVILNAEKEIKHVKGLTIVGFTDMGKSHATPLLIKNKLVNGDKIYYHCSEVDIVMFSENGSIAIPFSKSNESGFRYVEIITDLPNLLEVLVHLYSKYSPPTSTLFSVKLNENLEISINNINEETPKWMKHFDKHTKLFKTPCNKTYWYLFHDSPLYEGSYLFVTSAHTTNVFNYYALINDVWIETTEYWLLKECPKNSLIIQEYNLYKQVFSIESSQP